MDLLYLAYFTLIFIVSSAFVINADLHLRKSFAKENFVKSQNKSVFLPQPIFVGNSSGPSLTAFSAYVLDLNSQTELYKKEPDLRLLPASTTKILTALVAMDYYSPEDVLEVGKISVDGQKMHLVPGEKITVRDLLYGLLIFSANDAAEVLASNFPGGRKSFIASMNLKAKELNLENTQMSDPSGLEISNHFTTARDLAKLASFAIRKPLFKEIVATKEKVVSSIDGKITHKLHNLNELVGEVEGVLGVKTGWTPNSRENLVTYIEKDGKRIMIVLLGSEDRFGETKTLIDWMFSNYRWDY